MVSVSLVKCQSQQEAKQKHDQYFGPLATMLLEVTMLPEVTIVGAEGST